MGKSKDHKAQKAKARQEALRKQKAAVTAQPRFLREHPGLSAALSTRHPLVGYFVNDDWERAHMASVHVIRETETGQVYAGFLVDIWWRGLKDCFGNYDQEDMLPEFRRGARERGHDLIPLDPATAVNLIRGGLAWAQRYRYPLPDRYEYWLRLVDPLPTDGPDLTVFGENGERPIILGTLEEVERIEGRHPERRALRAPQTATTDDADDSDAEDEEDDNEETSDDAPEDNSPSGPRWLPDFLRRR